MPRARRQPQPGLPTRCPPKPCSPCPNSTGCCRCPTRPCTPAAGSERGRRSSRPSVPSRGTRTILKEPETRRLKNRGHLARNRKFESISLQRGVACEPEDDIDIPVRRRSTIEPCGCRRSPCADAPPSGTARREYGLIRGRPRKFMLFLLLPSWSRLDRTIPESS